MATERSRAVNQREADALVELSRRAEEIRDAVRARVSASPKLRPAVEAANETPEDVAQAVFLKLWGLAREGKGEAIRDLKGYAKTVADNYVASLARRPVLKITHAAEPSTVEHLAADIHPAEGPDQLVEQRLSAAEVASILRRLDHQERLLIKMRALGMSAVEMADVLGVPTKRCEKQLERVLRKIKQQLANSEDLEGVDRRRLSRVLAVKLWATPSLVAELRRDMRSDLRLASLWRQSNGAVHDVASAVAVEESLRKIDQGPGVADRLHAVVDRSREALVSVIARGGPEHETAAGAAAGGAGVATKAVVAACLAGSAAGGACVATGVVDLPDGGKPPTPTVVETTTTPPPTTTSEEIPTTTTEAPTTVPTTTGPENPVDHVNNELGLGGSTSQGSSSSGTRDFATPVAGGGSGGTGGGSSAGASTFNFEK